MNQKERERERGGEIVKVTCSLAYTKTKIRGRRWVFFSFNLFHFVCTQTHAEREREEPRIEWICGWMEDALLTPSLMIDWIFG